MPDALHVLRTTRSVRRRLDLDRPVAPEVLEECIEAAVQAPTGLDREAWRFVVVTEAEPKQRIAELYRRSFDSITQQWQQGPPADLADVTPPHERPTYVGLAVRAKGLGTTWTTLLGRESAAVAEVLGIPDDVTQTVLLPVAWTRDARLRPAARRPAREVTYWNGWGRER